MRHHLFLPLVLIAACGTATQRPASVAQPEIVIAQANPIFFGSGSSAPAPFDVAISNRANVPLRVIRLRVESSGMADYAIAPYERIYQEVIPPGETRMLSVLAMAYARAAGIRPSAEPIGLRIFVDFEAGGAKFREIVLQQLRPM